MAGEDERLRDAFAQLLAMGAKGAVPAEAVWAAQGRSQLPREGLPPERSPLMGAENPGYSAMIPRALPPDPNLTFPTAPAGPGSPEGGKPSMNPLLQKPFHGKGEVVGAYELPKKKKKGKD